MPHLQQAPVMVPASPLVAHCVWSWPQQLPAQGMKMKKKMPLATSPCLSTLHRCYVADGVLTLPGRERWSSMDPLWCNSTNADGFKDTGRFLVLPRATVTARFVRTGAPVALCRDMICGVDAKGVANDDVAFGAQRDETHSLHATCELCFLTCLHDDSPHNQSGPLAYTRGHKTRPQVQRKKCRTAAALPSQ
jgi:hypothetical protein